MPQTAHRLSHSGQSDERISELVPPADPRASIISIDPERHSGTPCFVGTRVPVQDLFDSLEGGESLQTFLASFPTVAQEQAVRVLQLAENQLFRRSFES